jgi:hypothetical protein
MALWSRAAQALAIDALRTSNQAQFLKNTTDALDSRLNNRDLP